MQAVEVEGQKELILAAQVEMAAVGLVGFPVAVGQERLILVVVVVEPVAVPMSVATVVLAS